MSSRTGDLKVRAHAGDRSFRGKASSRHVRSPARDRDLVPRRTRSAELRGGVRDGTILFAPTDVSNRQLATLQTRDLPLKYPDESTATSVFLPESDGFVFLLADRGFSLLAIAKGGNPERYLDSSHQVTFSGTLHPVHIFYVEGSRNAAVSLMTAPINPRTGQLKGTPVKLIEHLATVAGTQTAVFDTSRTTHFGEEVGYIPAGFWRLRWFIATATCSGRSVIARIHRARLISRPYESRRYAGLCCRRCLDLQRSAALASADD